MLIWITNWLRLFVFHCCKGANSHASARSTWRIYPLRIILRIYALCSESLTCHTFLSSSCSVGIIMTFWWMQRRFCVNAPCAPSYGVWAGYVELYPTTFPWPRAPGSNCLFMKMVVIVWWCSLDSSAFSRCVLFEYHNPPQITFPNCNFRDIISRR